MNLGGVNGIQNHIMKGDEPEEEIGNYHDVLFKIMLNIIVPVEVNGLLQ